MNYHPDEPMPPEILKSMLHDRLGPGVGARELAQLARRLRRYRKLVKPTAAYRWTDAVRLTDSVQVDIEAQAVLVEIETSKEQQ